MTHDELLQLIDRAAAEGWKELNLSGKNLQELPPEIGNLANLSRLYLYKNQLTSVPKELGNLAKLSVLSLSLNQLTSVPKELGNLAKLSRLDLSHSQLTSVPKELGNLPNLSRLDLPRNQLTSVPKELGNLAKLSQLDLSDNQLTSVPKELGNLAKLSQLYLHQNQLTSVPKELGNLANLSQLYLHHNQLTSVPKELGNLANLLDLSLSDNQLTSVPKELGNLANLSRLSLSQNQLTSVPKELGQLANLSRLDLHHNQLTSVPKELGQLAKLSQLDLHHNQLTSVPKELGNLANLFLLDLSQNPDLVSPPPEVIAQGLEAILAYLQEQQKDGEPQWISKLLVVGEGGVGKTSLLRALRGEAFKVQQSTTHGIEIKALPLGHPSEADVTMTLNTWDFGGQEIYHATHQFFLTNRSLFLLAFNARLGYEQSKLIYWLKTIRANAPESPVILVATWSDERDADIPYSDLKEQFPQIVGLYPVSNKTGEGIHPLKQAITQTAADLPLMGEIWPESWLKFANIARKAKAKHTTPSKFWEGMARCGISDEGKPVLATWLHELGDILFFKDNPELNDLVILKPQWVTQYISEVLEADAVIHNFGLFTRQCMDELWNNLTPGLRQHFLELMEQFDLSYKIPDDPEFKSLVVERLDYEPPNYQARWAQIRQDPACKEISMKFQLSEILAGIPTWFIARQHRFTLNLHWRTGVLFGDNRTNPRHLGLLRVERDTRTNADFVRLTVRGPMPHSFFDVLREGFELTLSRYPGLQITRLIPCPDPDDESCLYEFDYQHLEKRLLKDKRTLECPSCAGDVSIDRLLFGLTPQMQDLVLAKLDRIDQNMQEGFQELRELVQREFLRQFRRDQKFPESYCPNLFVLQPDNRSVWHRDIGSQRINLQLYCQYPGEVHPVCAPKNPPTQKDPAQGFYPIDSPDAWLRNLAPYVSGMVRVLKYAAPLVSPTLGYAAADLNEQVKTDVSLMNALVGKLPEITGSDRFALEGSRPEQLRDADRYALDRDRLSGSGLRALREFLKNEDSQECWGGLKRVLTPEGDYLWLCEEHEKVIYPS
ncbi:MAG: COR domain-containing protein [Elainellaceae cyanobacterium]